MGLCKIIPSDVTKKTKIEGTNDLTGYLKRKRMHKAHFLKILKRRSK